MSTNEPRRRDARHCPRCGAMGILPLDQPGGAHGEIQDPVMICPVCDEEFTAEGMSWFGAFNVADMTDEEIHEWAERLSDAIWGTGHEGDRDAADDPVELLDIDGGPDDDMGEWIPTPDMEDQARFFNDGGDPWEEDNHESAE
jgi:hypothetical protein